MLWAPLGDDQDAQEPADVALFQRSSGKTHFLTPLGALVLRELTLGPRALSALADTAHAVSGEPRDALHDNIHDLLVEFAARGLVRFTLG